jgi:hypothetical protein
VILDESCANMVGRLTIAPRMMRTIGVILRIAAALSIRQMLRGVARTVNPSRSACVSDPLPLRRPSRCIRGRVRC